MEVSYLNTYWDVVKFNLYIWPRHWFIQLSLGLFALFSAYIFSTLDVVQKENHSLVVLVLTYLIMLVPQFLGIAALCVLGCLLVVPRGPNAAYHRQRRIALTDQGVYEDTPVERSQAAWSGVHRVTQNGAYIFIFVTELGAHIIPKNAFASGSQAGQFFDYAYSRWQRRGRP